MKPDIHPAYGETQVTCTCGNTFTTKSTAPNGVLHADVCSACHPFYTGKQKILDTGGRVARFEKRYAQEVLAQPCAGPETITVSDPAPLRTGRPLLRASGSGAPDAVWTIERTRRLGSECKPTGVDAS